ncbi:MAG: hypothetical protein C4542_04440 [Dehalococcoidia bacterium]|nr:MAG: hypothetical protein C4542_04440 [Dehalococcoidia bacterium]
MPTDITSVPVQVAPKSRLVILFILAVFFISGACGLLYEVVWMKMLTIVFGGTALAISTTLAAFMSGLALGSFYFGRLIDRHHHPLRIYAFLELGTGLFAFLMPLLLSLLDKFYVFTYQNITTDYLWLSVVRLVLSLLILLIPATLMGGTLPVITRFLVKRFGELGSRVGQLYFINTMGAVVGTFATGFFLIVWLGVHEAAYLAGGLNILIAIAVLVLDRHAASAESPKVAPVYQPAGSNSNAEKITQSYYSPGIARLSLWAFAISGFCSLAYEVLWTRALVYILDNTAQAFTTMLVAFLLGIALGSLAITRFVDRTRNLLVLFGLAEVLIALFALISIPVFVNLGASIGGPPGSIFYAEYSLWQWVSIRFGRSLLVMLLPTLLMGMTFPIASKLYTRSAAGMGTAIGNIYSANTIGGVLGSFVAGFALIPWIGVYHSVMLIAAINTAIGLILLLAESAIKLGSRFKTAVVSVVCFITTLAVMLSSGPIVFASPIEQQYPYQILYYKEGVGSTVKVYQDIFADKTISIDGFPVAGTIQRHEDAQRSLGNLPLLLSQVSRPRVNLVGFGAGGASWAATLYNPSSVDCVELVPAVVQAARFFPEVNHGVMDNPAFDLIIGDGRNYLLVTDKKYDVITVDATSPKSAGSGNLYTREFYQSCKSRLDDNGLVVQWLPFHLLSEDEIKMTARTFMSIFPHTSLWFTFQRSYYILVGTQSELNLDFRLLQDKMADENIKAELAPLDIIDSYDVLSCFIMGEKELADYSSGARLNTDDHPYLEYSQTMSYFYTVDVARQNLSSIARLRQSVLPYLANLGATTSEADEVKSMLQARFNATPVGHFWPDYVN